MLTLTLLTAEVLTIQFQLALTCVDHCSDFVFDPAKWPRAQMEEDFLKLSQTFNAMRSVVRVPALDPKYKIAVLTSKQVHIIIAVVIFFVFLKEICVCVCAWIHIEDFKLSFFCCRTIVWLICYMDGRMEDSQ